MIRVIILFITLLIALPNGVAATSVNCKIHHDLHHGIHVISATYSVHLNKNSNGVFTIFGKYFDGTHSRIINRQVLFTYSSSDDDENVILTSSNINRYSSETIDEEAFKAHYPTFFSEIGKQMNLSIQPFSVGTLMISFMSAPLFICA